jgi:hypothetical protein
MASLEIPVHIAQLLAETPKAPELHPEGIPFEEKQKPTVSVSAPLRSSFKPALVKRCTIDIAPLLSVLAKEGNAAWDPAVQAESNIPFDRPAHDRWVFVCISLRVFFFFFFCCDRI